MNPVLSILIPSTNSRYRHNTPMIDMVYQQFSKLSEEQQKRVEVVVFADVKTIPLGLKRLRMYHFARGEYVLQLDDDDTVVDDFIETILNEIDKSSKPDVICYNNERTEDGRDKKTTFYSIKYQNKNYRHKFTRKPDYKMAIRRSIITNNITEEGLDLYTGEDYAFSEKITPLLKTESIINRTLYFYNFSKDSSETYMHRPRGLRRLLRPSSGVKADIIIVANSTNEKQREMTQKAINTAILGTEHTVKVTVYEKNHDYTYTNANTIHQEGEFNYNRYMNEGAKRGDAEYLVFCNNDLIFKPGWLEEMIKVDRPLVSPVSPSSIKQMSIARQSRTFIEGQANSIHLSGWCFMMKRSLWLFMGGLDDDVQFWCSDNVVICQAEKLGIKPVLAVKSIVDHVGGGSNTFENLPEARDLKWRSLAIFNHKYPNQRLSGFDRNSHYRAWLRDNADEVKKIAKMKFKERYI